MLLTVLSVLLIVAALVARLAHIPLRHQWRRRQARTMCVAFCGADRSQRPGRIYARLRATDALAFEELLLESFAMRGHKVVRNRRYTGDGGIDGQVAIGGQTWLIKAKRYASAIRPEHVEALTLLCRRRGRRWFVRLCLHVSMVIPALMLCDLSAAFAKETPANEREVARCIQASAGGRPWLEKTLWGLRDQEGGWIGAEIRNANGSHDLGPLQVNSWWVAKLAAATGRPALYVRWWLAHDACFNVRAAQWIFLSGLAKTREYWRAIGVYHSPTDWRQQRYSASVARHLRQRFGADVFRQSRAYPANGGTSE